MNGQIAGAARSTAFQFVLTMGVVNLFGDVVYEGGGSINGQFMAGLGASAAAIAMFAGLGEFLGYSIRSVSGYIADKTGNYWLVTFLGYLLNTLAVPAMALAGSWQVAGLLILAERTGRAIRKPTVEAMLSYTTAELGAGWVYAVNTALDEIGATTGPLIAAAVLALHGNYRMAYTLLFLSVILTLGALTAARINFPLPHTLGKKHTSGVSGFSAAFWLYMVAGACFAAGLMSFELISYHLSLTHLVGDVWIPVMLAFSTGSGVLANLALGKLYDRIGLPIVLVAVFLSSLFAPLLFQGSLTAALIAMPVWGIGYATQDTLLKAIVVGVLPEDRRNFAFGLFYTGYGFGWFVGSAISGLLYSQSITALIVFVMVAQLVSLPLFVIARCQKH